MELQEKLLKEIVPFNNPLIIEIGAADGEGTQKLLDLFDEATMYSFDADPRAIRCHQDYINSDRCTLINKAMSNEDGKMEFYLSNKTSQHDAKLQKMNRKEIYEKATETLSDIIPDYSPLTTTHGGWFYSSTILENQYNGARGLNWNEKVEVDVTTLDNWCEENNIKHIDLLWTDVEGAERRMLEGAENSLAFTDYILLEYGLTDMFPEAMSRSQTIDCMEKYGFSLYADYSDIDLLFKRNVND